MQQRIIGFHQDDEQHWVADLECGHTQHVRHDPPWQERAWVLDERGRNARLGKLLNCVVCDGDGQQEIASTRRAPWIDDAPPHLSAVAAEAYADARVQGLCHEGALEIAEGVARFDQKRAPSGGKT